MDDGTRTRDNLNHNQGLYQLSYNQRLRDGRLYALRPPIQEQIPTFEITAPYFRCCRTIGLFSITKVMIG